MKKTVLVALALSLSVPAMAVEDGRAREGRGSAQGRAEQDKVAAAARAHGSGQDSAGKKLVDQLDKPGQRLVLLVSGEGKKLSAALDGNPVLKTAAENILIEASNEKQTVHLLREGKDEDNTKILSTLGGDKEKAAQAYAQAAFAAALDLSGDAKANLIKVIDIANGNMARGKSRGEAMIEAVDEAKSKLGLKNLSVEEILKLCKKRA